MWNPARAHPGALRLAAQGRNRVFAVACSIGEPADLLWFGIVTRSQLVKGWKYKAFDGETKLVKECEIVLLAQEGERAMAMLNMVTDGQDWQVPITDDGGIVFSTMHTAIDSDGNKLRRM